MNILYIILILIFFERITQLWCTFLTNSIQSKILLGWFNALYFSYCSYFLSYLLLFCHLWVSLLLLLLLLLIFCVVIRVSSIYVLISYSKCNFIINISQILFISFFYDWVSFFILNLVLSHILFFFFFKWEF